MELYEKWRPKKDGDKEDINDDIVFEIELIKQVEVNIDYILMLVKKYHEKNCEDKEIVAEIRRAVDSSTQLRSKRELILSFLDRINVNSEVDSDWREFVLEQKKADLDAIIDEENLDAEETRKFIDKCLQYGELRTTGSEIINILPKNLSFFDETNNISDIKEAVVEKLKLFFNKYIGLGIFERDE